jgi:hypothetical protein
MIFRICFCECLEKEEKLYRKYVKKIQQLLELLKQTVSMGSGGLLTMLLGEN